MLTLFILISTPIDIRVGPETVSDPAYLVTRNMEDFVTWVDTSKIKRKIMKYNDKVSQATSSCVFCLIGLLVSDYSLHVFVRF